jgi:predicted RNase H-like HicB family nuclease
MLTLTLEYWEGEDGLYVGQLREVPGVMSQGRSLDELQQNIREAYELLIEESRSHQHHSPSFTIPISIPA